jgi:hypothetical protein
LTAIIKALEAEGAEFTLGISRASGCRKRNRIRSQQRGGNHRRVVNATLDGAIVIYARASRKWFGRKLIEKTQERIEQLWRAGDLRGVENFEGVKAQIARLESETRRHPFVRWCSRLRQHESLFIRARPRTY